MHSSLICAFSTLAEAAWLSAFFIALDQLKRAAP